jgi:exodeoxyribonuclease VII large subunit
MATSDPFAQGISAALAPRVLTVGELNRRARQALESSLPLLWVAGEISNLTMAASGHAYFTLKDAQAAVRAVMFRSRAQTLGWRLQNGDHVEAQVLVTLYEPRGDYQINVESMRRAGAGNLYEQFLRLKERLEREGLFAAAAKRPLPVFPRCIGLVTSPQGAALRDVATTIYRRAPHVRLIVYPTSVQGANAPGEIIAALRQANRRAANDGCELLILCRGGGSLEDLWAFNDENLARAVRASALPVVCGVGHETDFSIADFVADLRAPTPTAAAELAAPERARLMRQLAEFARAFGRAAARKIGEARQRLDFAAGRLQHPAELLRRQRERNGALVHRLRTALRHRLSQRRLELARLDECLRRRRPDLRFAGQQLRHLERNLASAAEGNLARRRHHLERLADRLRGLDPTAVLARGYSLTTDADGHIIKNAEAAELGSKITVHLARGRIGARVEEKTAAAASAATIADSGPKN